MASPQKENTHWLNRYATGFHAWTSTSNENGQTRFTRPLGLVETSFDSDGVYYGGRADMTGTLTLEVKHSLSRKDLRRRIALAWTALRLRHVLLMSRYFDDATSGLRNFAIDVPKDLAAALHDVETSTVWIEDHYASVDAHDLHDHALNVNRIIEPQMCMSKLHVLPLHKLPGGTYRLSFLIIMAHQISDGLSAYGWFKDLIRLLNQPAHAIESEITASLDLATFKSNLPPAQEDLYPKIPGTRARQRWIWAILRVLRHVQHTLPPTFPNPLYRAERLRTPCPLPPTYTKVFAYSGPHTPPLTTGYITAQLSPSGSSRLLTLCRSAQLSIGAGCFALAGLAMLKLHAQLHPHIPPDETPAMTASFPLNPRAFFNPAPRAESCMLAFSEGIVMPAVPAHTSLENRFVQTAKRANRELKVYQKRAIAPAANASVALDKHSPTRLLATGYISQIERVQAKLPPAQKLPFGNPQGELPAAAGQGATCGVSSVGSLKGFFRAGEYDLDEERDFVGDYRGLRMGVRAREGEFLVGSWTDAEGVVGFGVSYDQSAIEAGAAEMWARTVRGLLERGARL